MAERSSGFSFIESVVVVAILGVISAIAIPVALQELAAYRLQSDASAVASMCNVGRMKAASQFTPYSLDLDVSNGSYVLEQLCGTTPSIANSACLGTNYYTSWSPANYDKSGTQYLAPQDTFLNCRPSGVTGFPGEITTDPSTCIGNVSLYFNTRGAPVDSSGNPLTNGGAVVYLKNANALLDAVVVSLGGQVSVWTYNPTNSHWSMR